MPWKSRFPELSVEMYPAEITGREKAEDPAPETQDEDPIVGRTEAFGKGLTFGFGDRMGAGIQAALAKLSGGNAGETYDTALKENRGIYDRATAKQPGMMRVAEGLGAIPSMFIPGGAAGRAAGVAHKLAAAAKAATPLGFVSGLGHSRAELGSSEQLGDGVKGALVSAAAAPALAGGGAVLGKAVDLANKSKVEGLIKNIIARSRQARDSELAKPLNEAQKAVMNRADDFHKALETAQPRGPATRPDAPAVRPSTGEGNIDPTLLSKTQPAAFAEQTGQSRLQEILDALTGDRP
jgi:hypothetical protein